MTIILTRRAVIAGIAATAALPVEAGEVGAGKEAIHVVKDPGCGCCEAWVQHLADAGLAATVEERDADALAAYKAEMGVPAGLQSCHTATIAGYVVEGHVPAADIRRLLAERPDAIGLAVPGMPYGAPGMGPEDEREAYDVVLIRRDGGASVFARYPAA